MTGASIVPTRTQGFTRKTRILLFSTVAVLYLAIPNARPDFTRFNCNDSECYLALAWNVAHGHGYTRSMIAGHYEPHTTWPPGTPFLMVPAMFLSGPTINWYAVKWTMCLVGLAGVALTWLYLKDFTGHAFVADFGALALGLNPLYWDFSHQAMAELPLTVGCLLSLYLVHRAWSRPEIHPIVALGVGVISGLGMMFKGHAAALVFVPFAYLFVRPRVTRWARTRLVACAFFAAGFAVPQLGWMARNLTVPASGFEGINRFRSVLAVNPNDAQSPLLGPREFAGRAMRNLRLYAVYRPAEQIIPGLWAERVLAWKGSGWLALPLSVILCVALLPRFGILPVAFAIFPMVLLNLAYGFGGGARFWVPVTALWLVSASVAAGSFLATRPLVRRWCLAALFLNLAVYVVNHERWPYNEDSGSWRQLAELFDAVGRQPALHPTNVFTQNSNAFSLMTGFPASLSDRGGDRYDHAVLDLSTNALPAGARVVVSRPPFVFVALSESLTSAQIAAASKLGGAAR